MRKITAKKNLITVLLATTITALLLSCLSVMFIVSEKTEVYAEPAQTYNINSAEAFVAYARAYAAGDRNPEDVLNISISSGREITNDEFISIGTALRPFAGEISIPAIGYDTFRLSNCPLFDYVSTDAKITGAGVVKIIREKESETPAVGVLTSGALFANHVVAGTDAASWNISLLPYSGEGSAATDYSGVLGDIAANADVSVTFTNTSNLAVSGSGDTGLICGKLGAGATLYVSTAGSGGSFGVTSTGGNAGGLVGAMGAGATLTLESANNSRVNAVTSSTKYAGGIVGKAENVTATTNGVLLGAGVTDYAVGGTVTGASGAGGLFGYYKNGYSPATFDLEDTFAITGGMTVTGAGYTGGVFGLLENGGGSFTFDGNKSSETVQVTLSGGSSRGGVCGGYKASALTDTLILHDVKTQVTASTARSNNYSGGLIGTVETNAAYISVYDTHTVSGGSPDGGLIGNTGDVGSFLDVSSTNKVEGTFDGGLVGKMPQGVLRIKGTTDFSAYTKVDSASAFIVKGRGHALVYALGDGKGVNGNWTFKRNIEQAIDDISGWGEVLRTDGTILSESNLFTVDMSAHTVTLKGAYTTMSNVTQFALTALNISLNTGAGVGALQFTSGAANTSATLLGGTLTLGADVSLAGTGLTGLTRDDGENSEFSGTFDGDEHTVTLAIGEKYGLKGDGTALDADSKQGNICRHLYNGLFAEIGGATITDLTVSGDMMIHQSDGKMMAGGVAAFATGTNVLNNVTANFTLTYRAGADLDFRFGGAIGEASGNGLSVTVTGCTFTPIVNDLTVSGIVRGSISYIGGAIGFLSGGATSPTQSVTFDGTTVLGLTYTKTINTNRESYFGGAIAKIGNASYVKDRRTVSFADGAAVNVTATGTTANGTFGGILGVNWLACDVTISGLTVTAAITATGSTAAYYGGLVKTATGRWDIRKITLSSVSFTLPDNGSSFGFVANKTFTNESVNNATTESALYLDINDANYNIAALTFTGTPNFSTFDEIVADGRGTETNVTKNGNSVISVTTSGNVIDTSRSAYNTYLNKTAYGKSTTASHKINGNTRYYYNVADARANVATAKNKFLVWSVKTYAHSSLSAWFTTADSTFTGSLDMTGLSYYPVDLTENVTFNNATIKLDNNLMEDSVKYAYSGETGRTTRSGGNQHYLMHTAVFRNVQAGNITVTGTSDGLKLQGNVPKLSDAFCGFLVAGTLGGSDSRNEKFTASKIVFNDVFVSNAGANFTSDAYAPLLINKIGKNVSLTVSAAEQSGYASYAGNGYYAASSLIGDVGDSTARAIYLTFEGLKFDARTNAEIIGNMDAVYGTTKSIFMRATVLNSFLYFGESSGSYNFEIDEDWTDGTTAIHKVTYGKEITSSVENADKQKKYSGSEYYVHPTAYQSASEYDFSTGNKFLPYVYVAYDLGNYKHELSVNVTFSSVIAGCGKYGDPFIIDDNDKLPIISKIINGVNVGNTVQLYLPSDLTSYNYTGTAYTKYLYNFGTDNFISSNGGANQTNANVRKYLAGAYYVITKDITLPSDYVALGTTTSDHPEYAFRGVIIGRGNPTVTNNSRNPLIHSSNGSVIQGVTVEVDVTYNSSNVIELAAPTGSASYNYDNGIQAYGAVIGQILGGDNFIDGVQVTFTSVSFSITADETSTFSRLTPIGGYVGVIVNGGLVFRNMTAGNVGLTDSACDKINNSGYLYVNPIIGRVIAGYAFHETASYAVTSATLNNGSKNYTISDLSLSDGKLNVARSGSNFNITVPDGQAMFVLGAIVNSGAASATYNASTEQAYQGLSVFWQAYRAHTAVRAGATYSAVGTLGFNGTSDYTDYAVNDAYTSNLIKVPYIIRAYTNKTGNVYLARCISTTTANVVTVTGDCNVAAGFRGIGSIYLNGDNGNYTRLRISKMRGRIGETQNSYTITLNMRYLEYNHKSVSSYIAVAPNNSNDNTAGFGLFTRLDMTSPSSSNSVQYLTLAGSVFYDVYTIGGEQAGYNFSTYTNNDRTEAGNANSNTENVTQRRTILSVGGLAGLVKQQFYIKNVTFNYLSVEGAKSAGGLIGFVHVGDSNNVSVIAYDDPSVVNAGWVNVVGGLQAGGLVGRIYRAGVEITGASGGTDIIVKNIESKNTNPNETGTTYFANLTTGVGGLVGTCWAIDKKNNGTGGADSGESYLGYTTRRLFITNVNVVKDEDCAANVRVLHDTDGGNFERNNYAGGFLGSAHNARVKIENCKIEGVNVSANVAGGFIGKVTQKYFLEIFGCSADGSSKSADVSGTRYAGGAVGWAIGRDYLYFQLLNFSVKDYVIESVITGEKMAGAGGIVGYAQGNNKRIDNSSNYICEFNNLTVLNCDVKTNYTNKTDNYLKYKCGTGGIIGVIDNINKDNTGAADESQRTETNKYKFSGYNILVKDCTLTHKNGGSTDDYATNRRIGDIVGNNAVGSPLKFVGVAVQNNNFSAKHVGYYNNDNNNYGTSNSLGTYGDGYMVFANVKAASGNTSFGGVNDTSTDADDYIDVAAANPYVTVNPTMTVGGITLTGDGVAADVANLPIQTVLADASGLYDAAGAYYTGSSGNTNKQTFNAYTGKLAMFTSEMSGLGYLGTDFPVLVLDDSNRANSHKMINSYLRLLTNTRHDFGTDGAGNYEVKIYNVTYSEGVFTPSITGASLKRTDGQFYMTNAAFDSGKIQFSLIDLRFFNPADTSKVAYHLYVPVFVKKVLSYTFDISAQSGTTYLEGNYTDKYGDALIENIGAPVTLYFQYTYSRTASEWESAINAGENVNRNYTKKLLFYKANTNEILKTLPAGTVLVLVDPNNGGKPYYATVGTALVGNDLNLGAFRSVMSKDGAGNLTFSGDYFTPVDLDEMMTLSATTEGEASEKKMVACANNVATVVVSGQGYRLATDEELADGSVTKYKITVSNATFAEKYYLSIFTESNVVNDLLFHYYLITSPTSFGDPDYPSKIADTDAHTMIHLVMGKIFYHSGFTVSSDSLTHEQEMTNTNNALTVDLTSELGLSDDLDGEIRSNLADLIGADNVNVYQSFLVYLKRKEGNNVSKVILGNPAVSGEYAVDYVLNGSADVAATAYTGGNIRSTQNHVEVVTSDLSDNFATGNKFEINASVMLTYNPAGILSQFPGRGTTMPDNGVTVFGSSNIAFSSVGTTYSKNTVYGDETPAVSYYSEAEPIVAVLDLNPKGDKVGDFTSLGINALNNDKNNDGIQDTTATFDLLGVINATSVEEKIQDYASAKINIKLTQKQDDGSYGELLDVSEYFTVSFEGVESEDVTDNDTYYSVNIPTSNVYLVGNGAEIMLPLMHFTVKTGSAFESAGLTYSNYRVIVEAVLCNGSGGEIGASKVSNYVVYTNAKIDPNFLE